MIVQSKFNGERKLKLNPFGCTKFTVFICFLIYNSFNASKIEAAEKIKLAKKLDGKHAYLMVGTTVDKKFNKDGQVVDEVKNPALFKAAISTCPPKIFLEMKKNKRAKGLRKKRSACFMKESRYIMTDFDQDYYVYQIQPRESVTWEAVKFNFEMKKLSSIDWGNVKKSKHRRDIRYHLKGVRKSYLSPAVLYFDQKFEAGKTYFLGSYKISVGKKSFYEYGDGKYFKEYYNYLVPKSMNYEYPYKNAQGWLQKKYGKNHELVRVKEPKVIQGVIRSEFKTYIKN